MNRKALHYGRGGSARPTWQAVYRRYGSDRECLAAYLALEASEVLGGVKPANLLKLDGRRRPCGRNLYDLWKRHGKRLVEGSGLRVRELVDRGETLLILLYEPEALARLLAVRSVEKVLRKAGYQVPSNLERVLSELEKRMRDDGFPHEIGVFLGYPLKDVVGFLGWARLPFTCQGPWRIYGAPAESLRLADIHRKCRCRMAVELAMGGNPLECFRVGGYGFNFSLFPGGEGHRCAG
ncbi:MAG: hypothetical protein FD174_2693 [Geobacteraceae bacterium]|nr:MAG: hypothetical protein FD174_2693 [Geobacteraceae bacterium]